MPYKYDKEIRKILYQHQRAYYARNKDRMKKYSAMKKKEAKDNKKFYCGKCELALPDKSKYEKHLIGIKHNPDRKKIYICPHNNCMYKTPARTNYVSHLQRKKHKGDPMPEIKPYMPPRAPPMAILVK